MKKLNRTQASASPAKPEKILQFGGGNFLRGFADWILDVYNEQNYADLGILVVPRRENETYRHWQSQEGLYHVLTQGFQDGSVIDEAYLVKSVSRILFMNTDWDAFLASAENPEMRFVISNTTESGIRFSTEDKMADSPPNEFPAQLTLWLYRRYQYFQGDKQKGCVFLPTELILNNGNTLQQCILENAKNWGLEEDFKTWINDANTFCNTLVDRIVPGVSKDSLSDEWEKINFKDQVITQGEAFHFWAIEAPESVREELPLDKTDLNIVFTDDLTPYRTRKVRILNGAHTSMVPVGYLYGIETVREAVEHQVMGRFIRQALFDEIIPTLDLPDTELKQFANEVLDRFRNPFIKHQLISISLNSISKFKTRVLPSIIEYDNRKGELPDCLIFSLAALIHFYKGKNNGLEIPLNDDPKAISFLQDEWGKCDGSEVGFQQMATHILQWNDVWGNDLLELKGFLEKLAGYLLSIEDVGMRKALGMCLGEREE